MRVYLSPPHMNPEAEEALKKAYASNWIAPAGPALKAFEETIEEYHGVKHVLALTSATSALHLAIKNIGIQPGDIVLVPTHTFIATVNPIVYEGGIPWFIDSERDTWNMDPELLEEAIKSSLDKGKKPAAIMVVHIYGMPAKMKELLKLSKTYGIPIIEDAAEAVGSIYNNQHCGAFGHQGVYSYNGNKIITSGGGGALVTSSEAQRAQTLKIATQAGEPVPYFEHRELGYNYRMSNLLASVGMGQYKVLKERVAQRRNIFDTYVALSKEAGIPITFQPELEVSQSNRWLTTVLLPKKGQAELAVKTFHEKGIEVRRLWNPMHRQPIYKKSQSFLNGVSDDLFERGLCLPSGSALSRDAQLEVVQILKSILG